MHGGYQHGCNALKQQPSLSIANLISECLANHSNMPDLAVSKAPFPKAVALSPTFSDYEGCIPGQPDVSLDRDDVVTFLAQELSTPIIDELYSRLWLVGRRSGASIDPLHQQRVKGREIVPVENPQLHLLWHHDKFYVKPIPECLLNYEFWRVNLSSHACSNMRSVALGFVRSYAHLMRHLSDFALARHHDLLPEHVKWSEWCRFIRSFRDCEDSQVSQRYHYGQLRLSRLNWAVRLFQPPSAATGWFYEVPYWSIQIYVQRMAAPLVFGFASMSIVLSAMQVIASLPTDELGFGAVSNGGIKAMNRSFWVFSIAMLFFSGLLWVFLIVCPVSVLAWQISWGFKNRRKNVVKFTEYDED